MTHPEVKTGLEALGITPPHELKGKRLGLLANPASVDSKFTHASHIIDNVFPGQLKALFSPQHGFYADKQDNMIESDHGVDPQLNIPVFSLYSNTRIPTRDMMDLIDVLIIDLQDVGTRVYTFMYTMSYCLEAAAKQGRQVFILDRPNPVGGHSVEGNILCDDCRSFVGRFPLPMRHGLTMGELALFFNQEYRIHADVTVIPMKGWKREMFFNDTGLDWVAPSPNLPTPASALVYPGQVIFEGTNLSEGRGTTQPFEFLGAPFINPLAIVESISRDISGAHLRPICFEPTSGKWAGQCCRGFQIHVTDTLQFKPYRTALLLLQQIIKRHENDFRWKEPPYEYEFHKSPMDMILGNRNLKQRIADQEPMDDLEQSWSQELSNFKQKTQQYHLYT
ncbi:exo-beta-N-acetylmuramidase NamZ family protein [Desulfocicer niacini]